MSTKKMDLAYKIFSQIKELDKEIIALEKIANICSLTEGINVSFEMSVKEAKAESKSVEFDEDGSLVTNNHSFDAYSYMIQRMTNPFSSGGHVGRIRCGNEKQETKNTIKQELSGSTALMVLSAILSDKLKSRNEMINGLENIGFDISL